MSEKIKHRKIIIIQNYEIPEKYKEWRTSIDYGFNNFPLVDKAVANYIKHQKYYSCYCSLHFVSRVWFSKFRWFAEIMSYGKYIETVACRDLQFLLYYIEENYNLYNKKEVSGE